MPRNALRCRATRSRKKSRQTIIAYLRASSRRKLPSMRGSSKRETRRRIEYLRFTPSIGRKHEPPSATVFLFLGLRDRDGVAALLGYDVAQGYCAETEQDREAHVEQCLAPCTGTQQIVGLHAERRECREAAAEADHDKDSDGLRHLETAAADRQRAEEADDERSDDVDENCGPGKSGVLIEHRAAKRIPQAATDGTTERNPEIEIHFLPHICHRSGPNWRLRLVWAGVISRVGGLRSGSSGETPFPFCY